MTSETRITIEPADFMAIEFECSECHHRLARPMGAWRSIIHACPNCGANWNQYEAMMKYLANMASQIPKYTPPSEGEKWPFTIRFEIRADGKS